MSPIHAFLLAAAAAVSPPWLSHALAQEPTERPAHEHAFELDVHRRPELRTGGSCVIRGATIHSAVGEPVVGDVLVLDGLITAIGAVGAPEGIVEIDARGRHLAPGVVDAHSHTAVRGGVNESTLSITCEVRIADSLEPDDIAIYRALAGGVTTAHLMHGSANAIGGQGQVVKLKWERSAEELLFPGAPKVVKFALGENPKRSNTTRENDRFPATRMGVEAIFHRAFERAREFQRERDARQRALAAGEDPPPLRRDLRLEALAEILEGSIVVHSHCYRADEILMLLRAAEQHGFRVGTLHHVLEGYKVAQEIAEAGVGASTFSDWWAFKVEAYDAIPENAALMDAAGIPTSLNSDSNELMRRMYGEAAKMVRYAGLDRVRALALVTLNPARQLGIADRVGSIEVGKHADLVLLDGDPLSSLARVLWTMVDGEVEFQRRDAFGLDESELPVRSLVEDMRTVPWNPDGGAGIAITGGTLHLLDGPPIEGGTLLIQDGLIVGVGQGLQVPAGARQIDVSGKHVWPGMIALGTAVGIREIGSISATLDVAEIGGDQPDLRTSTAVHAESAHVGVTRAAGITRVQVAPQGGGPMMGQSALVKLDGETWEDMLVVDRDMLHVSFPRVSNDAEKKDLPEAVQAMSRLLADAREYARLLEEAELGAPAPRFDPRLAALVPYVRGERPVALHADNAQTILFALRFAREEELRAVLYGAREAWKVADAIAREGVPVALGPVLALPTSRFDPYDSAYASAAVLHRAGVQFAILAAERENTRNLPFHAGMAAAFGLPRQEAVRAITYYPARILGLEQRMGSLAPGKVADVLVTSGDLLEITSTVQYLFIDGRQVDLANRQTELRDRYSERLERLRDGRPSGR